MDRQPAGCVLLAAAPEEEDDRLPELLALEEAPVVTSSAFWVDE